LPTKCGGHIARGKTVNYENMKTLINWIAPITLAIALCGCVHFPTAPAAPSDSSAPAMFSFLKSAPATTKAKAPGQPVASAVASIVHYCEIAGALCLLAAGALGYFGNVLPAIKVGIAGIALIVFAKWFDYHYGIVIAVFLVTLAGGFLWAWYKNDPNQVAELTAKIKSELAAGQTLIEKKI
jgi:hypothetical protein